MSKKESQDLYLFSKENNEKLLSPLPLNTKLILMTSGGGLQIMTDIYDNYLNMPNKIIPLPDIANYLDIFKEYHKQFPEKKNLIKEYLNIEQGILNFNQYLEDYGTNIPDEYLISSTTGKIKFKIQEYLSYLNLLNPNYSVVPYEFLLSDAGKKKQQRFINKLQVFFKSYEKRIEDYQSSLKNQKEVTPFHEQNFILPYFLSFQFFLLNSYEYKLQIPKVKGLLIFTGSHGEGKSYDLYTYDELVKDKENISMLKDKFPNIKEFLIMASSQSILDLILGLEIGCTHFEIEFPFTLATEGKAVDIKFDNFDSNKNYGLFSDIKNFDYELNVLDLKSVIFTSDINSINDQCQCFSCIKQYSKGYINHLFRCREINGSLLLAIHNCFQIKLLHEKLVSFDDINKKHNFIMWFIQENMTKKFKSFIKS